MSQELIEGLDQAIDATTRGESVVRANVDLEIAELLRVAADLRDLPRAGFKVRLKEELKGEIEMSTATKQSAVKPADSKEAPSDTGARRQTVTPYLVVSDVHQEIDFIKEVFGATGKSYGLGSQGGFHSEYRIGDSMLMIGGGGKRSKWKGTPVP